MRQQFNKEITDYLVSALPSSVWLWQVRGIVLNVVEVEHPSRDKHEAHLRDLLVQVGDLDHGSDGFDVRVENVSYQIEPNDIVSLIGHERKDAKAISHPRLIINHSTAGSFRRVYPLGKRLPYGEMPLFEYKYWLAQWARQEGALRRSILLCWNFWKVLAWLFAFWVLGKIGGEKFWLGTLIGGSISAAFFLIVALSILPALAALKAMERLVAQPPFSYEKRKTPSLLLKNFGDYTSHIFFDLTPVYEELAHLLDKDARENPAPEIEFVPRERGLHMAGLLRAPTAF